jgi:uncharacterized membrane protein
MKNFIVTLRIIILSLAIGLCFTELRSFWGNGSHICSMSGCQKAQQSVLASPLGLPLTFWGGLAAISLLVLTLLCSEPGESKLRKVSWGFGLTCMLVAVGLQFFNLFANHAVCNFCLVLASLFVIQFMLHVVGELIGAIPKPRAWPLLGALILGLTASSLVAGQFDNHSQGLDTLKKLSREELVAEPDRLMIQKDRPILVLFQDFECYGCSELWRSMREEIRSGSRFQVFIRHAALPNHKDALKYSALFEIAAKGGLGFEFADKVHLHEFQTVEAARRWLSDRTQLTDEMYENAFRLVKRDNQDVARLGISGVPVFVYESSKIPRYIGSTTIEYEKLLNSLKATK